MRSSMTRFRRDLIKRFWAYQQNAYPDWERYSDARGPSSRPPVFRKDAASHNVLVSPGADCEAHQNILSMINLSARHRWFGSMNSSQALAQSVLGNLAVGDHLGCLREVQSDEGLPILANAPISSSNLSMEHQVHCLGEPRPTELDAHLHLAGGYQIAIECKFTEAEMGTCSRPRLTPKHANFGRDYCDGSYRRQGARQARCSLAARGVLYWRYTPEVFTWRGDQDHDGCPLRRNYQLVRNVLAVAVCDDGRVDLGQGHVLLIYDERNPAFGVNGEAYRSYCETRQALHCDEMLRKCSWQRIIRAMRRQGILSWLTEQLALKYGL